MCLILYIYIYIYLSVDGYIMYIYIYINNNQNMVIHELGTVRMKVTQKVCKQACLDLESNNEEPSKEHQTKRVLFFWMLRGEGRDRRKWGGTPQPQYRQVLNMAASWKSTYWICYDSSQAWRQAKPRGSLYKGIWFYSYDSCFRAWSIIIYYQLFLFFTACVLYIYIYTHYIAN